MIQAFPGGIEESHKNLSIAGVPMMIEAGHIKSWSITATVDCSVTPM
jgi:hypothetical protein